LFVLALIVAGLWQLDRPPSWWDEGWTLSVARNAAQGGFYGRMLLGQPGPPGLEAAPAVVLPVAATFEVLGVGLWQGRIFGVLCAAGAVAALFALAARLYDQRAAWGAIGGVLLLSMHPQLNPLIQGRQVLGELPMLLWLLCGYLCLLAALHRQALWLAAAALLWAVALNTKTQALPFWGVSLVAAVGVALLLRRWRAAGLAATGLGATLLIRPWVGQAIWLSAPPVVPGFQASEGIVEVLAVVTQPSNRLFALRVLLFFGLPTLLALMWALWRVWRERAAVVDVPALVLRVALLALAGSWAGWFALLSVGVPRYLFPATFIGAVFLGALLRDLTGGFNLGATLEAMRRPLRRRRDAGRGMRDEKLPASRIPHPASLAAWLGALIVAAALPLTLLAYTRYYVEDDQSAQRVADFLNTRTPADALVETYESELHFFLERPYHYPSDQTHVALNRRSLLGQAVRVEYDPLVTDPDYLVVGQFARGNKLYEPVIQSGAFRLLFKDELYEVYERIR
jgi:hypothetical protein